MARALVKIAALVATIAGVSVLAYFLRFRCEHLTSPFLYGSDRLLVMVTNQQQVGEELDLADGNVQLLCNGFSEHDRSNSLWSARATVASGASANLTLPAVRGDEVFEVLCSYRGANRCWAHGVRLLWNPGHDLVFCTEELGGCEVTFREDGGVEKQYGTASSQPRSTAQPPIFLGFAPDFDNARDPCTSNCIGRKLNRVIGEESCCDDSCGQWERASATNKQP